MAAPYGDQSTKMQVMEEIARFEGPMPTGVTVSHKGRIFVCFPKWGDAVDFTVAEMIDGYERAYPDQTINRPRSDDDQQALVSVQSVVVDPQDRLWLLDTGSPEFAPTSFGGPKLVGVDLTKNQVFQTILFPRDVALPTTYLNDIRFDLRRGDRGMAFITDSSDQGPNAIIVVDLATGASWRRLHDHPSTKAEQGFRATVDGQQLMVREPGQPPKPLTMGADGIAIGAGGSRLYYCPLAARRLYSVDVDALVNRDIPDDQVAATVVDEGEKPPSDGLESDADGCIYVTDYEHNAVHRRHQDGHYELLAQDAGIPWPDTLSLAGDGYLYLTANQLQRQAKYQNGQDQRTLPYRLFRVRVDAKPVRLT